MAKILKTSELVTTSLRRASIPAEESAFTTQDVIDILNEEMQSYIMPVVMRLHEDFYLTDEPVSIETDVDTYKIPYRATGNKLYDVQYQDAQSNLYETVRVTAGTRPEYSGYYRSRNFLKYYIRNDSIVLLDNTPNPNDSLLFSYYLRPNDLVKDTRGAAISSIGNEFLDITVTSYSDLVTDTITINGTLFTGVSTVAIANQFQAVTDNNTTATNIATAINNNATTSLIVTANASAGVITISSILSSTELTITYGNISGTIGATLSLVQKEFTISTFPTHFSTTTSFDFIQKISPSKILLFDKPGTAINTTAFLVTFNKSDIPTDIAIGDYIMKSEEAITAQLPTELQPLLAQKTACKLLESLGDSDGLKLAIMELDRLERNLNTLIDTRVDESIIKAHNRHTSLREFSHGRGYNRGY